MIVKKLKQKRCRQCKELFDPVNSLHVCCTPTCAISHAESKREANQRRDITRVEKIKRADLRVRKEALKSLAQWKKDAQNNGFNPYIRGRDEGDNCISCGKSEAELKIKNPISMVCGHFLSVGSAPELRYHPFNANLQCTRCNGGAGKYGQFNSKALTVTQEYRVNLIKKIGLENVEWLEGPHEAQHLQIDDLKEIKVYYREQLKLIKG